MKTVILKKILSHIKEDDIHIQLNPKSTLLKTFTYSRLKQSTLII